MSSDEKFCCYMFEAGYKQSMTIKIDIAYNNKYYIPTIKIVENKLYDIIDVRYPYEEKVYLEFCPFCGSKFKYREMKP